MRCSRSCFKEVVKVFSESGEIDKVVEIKRKDKSIHLPESIFTEEVDEELEKKCERKGNKNKQKVNKKEVITEKGQLLNQFVTENTHAKLVFSLT